MKAFKLLLWKAYFDKGLGLTYYFKYLIAFGGIFKFIDGKTAIFTGIIYLFSCFILGWLWYNFGLIDVENEVGNIYNPFQREVRQKLSRTKV